MLYAQQSALAWGSWGWWRKNATRNQEWGNGRRVTGVEQHHNHHQVRLNRESLLQRWERMVFNSETEEIRIQNNRERQTRARNRRRGRRPALRGNQL